MIKYKTLILLPPYLASKVVGGFFPRAFHPKTR